MVITDEHVAKTKDLFNIISKTSLPGVVVISPQAVGAARKFLSSCAEKQCLERLDIMIFDCLRLEYEYNMIVLEPHIVTQLYKINRNLIYQTLCAILGPIYFRLDGRLPKIYLQNLEQVLHDPTPLEMTKASIVGYFREFNSQWADLVEEQIAPLERLQTKATIYLIAQMFIRNLNEPLES